ncbi:hypothetical protein HXX76_004096 [Chlamydomonas incerta]|uniref:CTLH domain-containing protein n=1 Tax=Chlamydomonas incerta TaxID=51695 RepID=A0A835W793_CHLIN|nr:hypothetical protein HXX76_004096 [Chlamydomonas incerta]|eukprot:KAG2439978.1 hypothetical protein HXX76_004096 [Chlamydomonas incerta]
MSLPLSETLEAPLMRVPFESLKRAAKDRKALIDELSDHLASLKHPLQGGPAEPKAPSSSTHAPAADPSGDTEMEDAAAVEGASGREASIERLRLLLSQLQGVKRKLAEVSHTEADDCARCKARLDYLAATAPAAAAAAGGAGTPAAGARGASVDPGAASPAPPGAGGGAAAAGAAGPGSAAVAVAAAASGGGGGGGGLIGWTRQRLDVILVDHLLRSGYHDSAAKLAAAAGIPLLTDAHIFEGARRVLAALLEDHDCGPALAWCAENRSRLAKSRSGLEYKLRLQQFIELVRSGPGQRGAAIAHARSHLAPWVAGAAAGAGAAAPPQQQQYMVELQRAVATLAFPAAARERMPAYKALFEESAWRGLADLFLRDLYRLHSLTPESLLTVYLQAGLSALKTPASGAPGGSREDPLRLPAFQRLAAHLPFAKHMHSKLVCAVTKELMSDANPPLLLPNGYVYSTRGIELLLAQGVPGVGSSSSRGGGGSGSKEERGRTPTPPGGLGGGARTPAPEGLGAGGGGGGGAMGVCPMTGLVFRRDELRRLYIA